MFAPGRKRGPEHVLACRHAPALAVPLEAGTLAQFWLLTANMFLDNGWAWFRGQHRPRNAPKGQAEWGHPLLRRENVAIWRWGMLCLLALGQENHLWPVFLTSMDTAYVPLGSDTWAFLSLPDASRIHRTTVKWYPPDWGTNSMLLPHKHGH